MCLGPCKSSPSLLPCPPFPQIFTPSVWHIHTYTSPPPLPFPPGGFLVVPHQSLCDFAL